jgi:hypothetical protein
MDDQGGEEPKSDDLYDWVEDDEVAAEGLLIDEVDPGISGATPVAASESTLQVLQTSTTG